MKISESRQHISIGQTYQDNRVNHESTSDGSTVIYGDERSGHGGDSTSQSADSSGHSGDSTRAKIDQVDATLFAEQPQNNVVIKVRQHLLN